MSNEANSAMDSVTDRPVRYAVVGLGHLAQTAILPAFRHAKANSKLTALVSGDAEKRKVLGKKYRVRAYSYDEYDACLASGDVDAVYIVLPNHLHCEYTVRAAEAHKHILCEKPMAVEEPECWKMVEAADSSGVSLMIAYRLHFDRTNLAATEIAQSGQLGDLRFFQSTFALQVREGNVRTRREMGGGTLYDIGVYCINAARYVFRDEPTEVFASSANNGEPRFAEIDEITSAVLKFPQERLAAFTASFGGADLSSYRVIGTKGDLLVEPAYDYMKPLRCQWTVDGKTKKRPAAKRDQFAAEMLYFSDCILKGQRPEPSGIDGLADVRIIEAIYRSAREGRPISIEQVKKDRYPTKSQEIYRPPVSPPDPVHAESPGY